MKSVKLSLALQGGGAHGAFTWGVLNRILDEKWLTITGISGASAGSMNAVMFAEGWRKNGREGAKQQLADFWYAIAEQNAGFELPGELKTSVSKWWLSAFQFLSPYDVNLLDINPLRDIVADQVDFPALQKADPLPLYIAATEVSTGKLALFNTPELTTDHLLASACLPNVYKAIEINGKHYWDGGYAGNPAIFPLMNECSGKDVLIVLLQPLQRDEVPKSSDDISDRITEISFHSNFMREMRAIASVQRLVSSRLFLLGKVERQIKQLRTHLITNGELLASLDSASKYDNRKEFLESLRNAGEESTEQWLRNNAGDLGSKPSCDIQSMFE